MIGFTMDASTTSKPEIAFHLSKMWRYHGMMNSCNCCKPSLKKLGRVPLDRVSISTKASGAQQLVQNL
ncbi:hypothetical protein V6N13_080111 [Hibiscus sabdariffa]